MAKWLTVWAWSFAGLSLLVCVSTARAQQVDDYIMMTPRPGWTLNVAIPDYDGEAEFGRDSVYALTDFQNRHGLTSDDYSTRYVVDLLTPAAVEEEGTISLDFDPSYDQLSLHHVKIVRDSQTIDAIDLSEAMMFRTETDRDQMIFNGTLTFSMPVLDLRVGDRLDIAYTISGRNPAIKSGYLSRRIFGTSGEVKRRFQRVLIEDGASINTLTHNGAPEPERFADDGWTILQWDSPDPQAANYDTDTPDWAFRVPTYEISNFASWSEVGDLFADYYVIKDGDRAAVADIVAEIAAAHDDPKVRARAALDWVQTNIRYVALALGEGGFVPRRPERVLLRRFGDCKDVTLLLLTLLDELGISADPMLVDLDERGGEFKGLPNPYAFNHIKVLAEIDGKIYPMDATRDPQLGTLDTMERGSIAFGLRMGENGATVTRLPPNEYPFRERATEVFDSVSEPGTILYTMTFEEYGGDADGTVAWLASDGEQSVTDSFVEYLDDIFPTLERIGPMDVTVDEEAAFTSLVLNFRMPLKPDTETVTLNTRAWQVLPSVPDFEGGTRTQPFAIRHHRDAHHIRQYIVAKSEGFEAKTTTFENAAFRFTARDTVEADVFREDYRWTSKQDFIAAADFEDVMSEIDDVRDASFSKISFGVGTQSASSRPEDTATDETEGQGVATALAWLFLILFPLGVGALMWRSHRAARVNSLS